MKPYKQYKLIINIMKNLVVHNISLPDAIEKVSEILAEDENIG